MGPRVAAEPGRRGGRRIARFLLSLTAIVAAGIVVGAAYALVSPDLAAYVPFQLLSGWFYLIVLAACAAVALALGQPRAAIGSVPLVAAIGAAVFGLVLAMPAFGDRALNAVGLTNYAITHAAAAFFLLLPFVFFGVTLGLVAGYIWHDRRS